MIHRNVHRRFQPILHLCARVLTQTMTEPSEKDLILEFVQLLELLADYIEHRDLNSRLTPTARLGDESSSMELRHRNCWVCRPGLGLP
jgi:hypothetical protein